MEGILERLRREVKQRRLLLYPYFRDYDRVSGERERDVCYVHSKRGVDDSRLTGLWCQTSLSPLGLWKERLKHWTCTYTFVAFIYLFN